MHWHTFCIRLKNTSLCSCHSADDWIVRNSASATRLSTPSRCSVVPLQTPLPQLDSQATEEIECLPFDLHIPQLSGCPVSDGYGHPIEGSDSKCCCCQFKKVDMCLMLCGRPETCVGTSSPPQLCIRFHFQIWFLISNTPSVARIH